jgi:protein phosphatase
MGTTIVALLIATAPVRTAYVAHLGDSRAYRYRAGTLAALTRDHTMIEKYLRHGVLTEEAARRHPERHVLTRALGMAGIVQPDIGSHDLARSDLFLLCSDGLTKMLEDHEIAAAFANGRGDPIRICDHLIDESLRRGGEDNVTVVVIAHP